MEIWEFALLALVGVFAGWLNVMAGGGSLIILPVMLFLGIPAPVANGTNRVAIAMQNITAVITFFKRGFSDFKLSLTLALAAVPGAYIGAMAGTKLTGEWFDRLLALVMIAVMILMALPEKKSPNVGKPSKLRTFLGHLCMVGAGFWGGFIQVGVGFILMPILHRVMGLDLVRVNMHKVFIVFTYTLVALAVFASEVEIFWMAGLCLGVGTAVGGWLGAHMSIIKGERLIRIVINLVLAVFVIKLLFF